MTKQKKPTSRKHSSFVKYMGLPFQLVALIGLAAYVGNRIDKWMDNENPLAMLGFAFLALTAFLAKIVITESK